MKGVLPWLVRWARRAGIRIIDICSALAALVEIIIFLTATSNLGRQSCWLACLCVSGLHTPYILPNIFPLTI
jgi:hypothetical protein